MKYKEDFNLKTPYEDLIPPLQDDEFKLLEESVLQKGVINPILVWNDIIIDGHNRYRICQKHNLKYPIEEIEFKDETDAKLWIIKHQMGRRNLTPYQKADLALQMQGLIAELKQVAKEKKVEDGKKSSEKWINTLNLHRKSRGVWSDSDHTPNHEPVVTQTKDTNEPSEHFHTWKKLSEIAGVSYDTLMKTKKIKEYADDKTKEKLKKGIISVNQAYKEVKKKIKQEELKKEIKKRLKEYHDTDSFKVINDDFRNVKLDPNSVDLILTDYPYTKENVENGLLDDFVDWAYNVLKPSHYLITYWGHMFLPEAMEKFTKKFKYYWTIALMHTGNTYVNLPRNVAVGWKPILVFQKPPYKPMDNTLRDVIKGSGTEKGLHEWQQAVDEVEPLIKKFTIEGDLIIDPFAGSGSFGIKAWLMKRRVINIELNKDYAAIIKKRFSEVRVND